MGTLLGKGSTGSVRIGRVEDVDVAVKLLEEADDPDRACQKLQHELNLYQGPLHLLQGVSVPRLMASGTMAGPTGNRQPLFALELLPISLSDVEARLGASDFECVLEALNRIHQQGVLHGDIEPRHVVYSSQVTWTRNAKLGRFTNFVNLLDMCAVSVPSAVYRHPQIGEGIMGQLRLSGNALIR